MSETLLVVPIFISHEGCPHQCLFCNQHAITGKPARRLQPIGTTIEQWLARSPGYRRVQVAFYGGSFTCLPPSLQQRLLGEVRPYLLEGRVSGIRLSTRPDCITEEIVAMLRALGVVTVELGVQSLDDRVLAAARRGHTAEDSRRAIALLRAGGIEELGVQLLPGLPGEGRGSFFRTVRGVIGLHPDFVRLYPALVVAVSPLEKIYRSGGYRPMSLNRAVALCHRAKALFSAAAIPVVRMGLQPSESLERELVAGPYHPAFGELVASRQWFLQIRKRLSGLRAGERCTVKVSHRDYSAVVGRRRMNIARLEQLGYAGRLTVIQEHQRVRGSIEYVVD